MNRAADKDPGQALEKQLRRNRMLDEQLRGESFNRAALERVQEWQRKRLASTYADLYQNHRYRAACSFFLDEIYGGLDFDARNRQLERVAPVMQRLLPDYMVLAVAEALGLQAMSLEFDCQLARLLENEPVIDQPRYAEAYRRQGDFEGRRYQIELIRHLGQALDDVVHRPGVKRLVSMMRFPARAAGFGALQDFLEQGLSAFATMDGAEEFLDTIERRETRGIEAIASGEDRPFEDDFSRNALPGSD